MEKEGDWKGRGWGLRRCRVQSDVKYPTVEKLFNFQKKKEKKIARKKKARRKLSAFILLFRLLLLPLRISTLTYNTETIFIRAEIGFLLPEVMC